MPDEFQVGDEPITPAVDTTSAPDGEATEAPVIAGADGEG